MKNSIIVLLTVLFVLGSCATSKNVNDKVAQVQKGMSKDEVTAILGQPSERRFIQEQEEWEYRLTVYAVFESYYKYVYVAFAHDRVIGLQTYSRYPRPAMEEIHHHH